MTAATFIEMQWRQATAFSQLGIPKFTKRYFLVPANFMTADKRNVVPLGEYKIMLLTLHR